MYSLYCIWALQFPSRQRPYPLLQLVSEPLYSSQPLELELEVNSIKEKTMLNINSMWRSLKCSQALTMTNIMKPFEEAVEKVGSPSAKTGFTKEESPRGEGSKVKPGLPAIKVHASW